MPPLTTKKSDGPQAIRKDVEWVTKDDAEQVGTGIVMVSNKVDLQNDFLRPEQLREFAEQFENFESVGEAGGGVMHAVFPDDHLTLERNEVLDEPETIGGKTVPAGAWVQSWEFEDDQLWSLVEDGILAGYSVGIDGVRWDGPYEQDDDSVADVEVPPEIDSEELIWKIVDGIMREVSTVDIPAVPDAQILDKAAMEKRLGDHLGNRDAFLDEAQERGHSEEEAEQLWEYLNDAVDIEGAGEPGKQSFFERVGKAAMSAIKPGSAGDTPSDYEPDPTSNNPDVGKEGRTLSNANRESAMAAVDANLDILEDAGVDHGMTRFTDRDNTDFDLSEHDARSWTATDDGGEPEDGGDDPDVENARAVAKEDTVGVDVFRVRAAEDDGTDYDGDLLGMGVDFPEHDVYVDWRREAFPEPLDDPHVSVYGSVADLEQATGNVIESLDTVDSPTDQLASMAQRVHRKAVDAADASSSEHATGGETPDDDTTSTDMTDENDSSKSDDEKSLDEQVEKNAEQISDLTQAVEDLTETLTGPEAKTAEIEIDGETHEVREDAAKAALGVDEDSDIGVAEAIEQLNEKAARVDEVEDRLDTIQRQSGHSTQIEAAAAADDGGDEENLEQLGKALN
jgi:hypothetical protein